MSVFFLLYHIWPTESPPHIPDINKTWLEILSKSHWGHATENSADNNGACGSMSRFMIKVLTLNKYVLLAEICIPIYYSRPWSISYSVITFSSWEDRSGVSDAIAARQVEGEQLQCWQNGSNLIYAKAKQGLDWLTGQGNVNGSQTADAGNHITTHFIVCVRLTRMEYECHWTEIWTEYINTSVVRKSGHRSATGCLSIQN